MRGCLSFVVFVALLVAGLAWIALPPAAGALVGAALVAGGLNGIDTTVTVSAAPPFELLTLHADEVHVRSRAVQWHGLRAATLDLTLRDVALGDRTFGGVSGRLTDVVVTTSDRTGIRVPFAIVSGTQATAAATFTLDPSTVEELAATAVERALGVRPASVSLAAPDRVILSGGGAPVVARLAVDPSGALVLRTPQLGTLDIVRPGPGVPIRFSSVAVAPDGVSLGGLLDVAALTG